MGYTHDEWTPFKVMIRMGQDALDAIGVFDACTQGDDWNGFATPFFTYEEGLRVSAWTEALARAYGPDSVEVVTWNVGLGAFVISDPQHPRESGDPVDDEDVIEGTNAESLGRTLYGIGAYKWTWEVAG